MKIKKIIGPMVLASLTSLAANASYLDGPASNTDYYYADIKIAQIAPTTIQGNSDLQSVAPNTTYSAGFALGRKFMDRFRTELEYMHRGNSDISNSSNNGSTTNKWSVSADSIMLNVTTDIITESVIRPYVKLGLGLSINTAGQYTNSQGNGSATQTLNGSSSSHFAWQAGFGLTMNVNKAIETKIEYAFVDRGEFRTSNGTTVATNSINSSESSQKTGKLKEQVITLGIGCKF